jgi:3-oxoacyl-[acyl-carrier protein] reductase
VFIQYNNLKGKVALITGVSRLQGIGFAIANRLAARGADLFLHSYTPYDQQFPWAQKDSEIPEIIDTLKKHGRQVTHQEGDLHETDTPTMLIEQAYTAYPHIDILVLNHAYSTEGKLHELTAENIDAHLLINVRASLLLIKEWSLRHDDTRAGGRVIMLTSGQHLAPMSDELSYVASKGAIHQLTLSLSHELVQRGITVNAVNPGATDTVDYKKHYPELYNTVLQQQPQHRWGKPDDAARLIAWLASDEAQWISGQVINSDGGVHF